MALLRRRSWVPLAVHQRIAEAMQLLYLATASEPAMLGVKSYITFMRDSVQGTGIPASRLRLSSRVGPATSVLRSDRCPIKLSAEWFREPIKGRLLRK